VRLRKSTLSTKPQPCGWLRPDRSSGRAPGVDVELLDGRGLPPADHVDMADGSIEKLNNYSGRRLLKLFVPGLSEFDADQGCSHDVDLIARSVSGSNPGGGFLIAFLRALKPE